MLSVAAVGRIVIIVGAVAGVLVFAALQGLLGSNDRRPAMVRCAIMALVLLVLAALGLGVWTSGIRSADWVRVRAYAQGADTIVHIGDVRITLADTSWPQPYEGRAQIRGWTGSASGNAHNVAVGAPGYVYLNYNGKGVNELTLGETKLRLESHGEELVFGANRLTLDQGSHFRLRKDGAVEETASEGPE